ncbi:MAG: galactose mutarotase [Planctomycetaceae bacterium]|nr:galactose mutarotase [Planctomycetaceae bacterium]
MRRCTFRTSACGLWVALAFLAGCSNSTSEPGSDAGTAAADSAERQSPESNSGGEPLLPTFQESEEDTMEYQHATFGKTEDGQTIEQYTLTNSAGTTVSLINYGATVVSVKTPDREGHLADIVLGHSSVDHWLANSCYFGCTVGRYGNRIGNSVFGLGDNIYRLPSNDGGNHLHGGPSGFSRVLWDAEAISDESSASVVFTRISPDGEEGYPGSLNVTVTYTLNEDNELRVDYEATTDATTVVNLTNHCYWNLTGDAASTSVLQHELQLFCNLYLPVNDSLLPTGDLLAVADTPMNFFQPETIGSRIAQVDGGYDHCYVVNREVDGLAPVARVSDPSSGRVLEIFSTEPGVQFYSGNFLDGSSETGGFAKHHGFCLETQHYPDSPNHPTFPSTVLEPGDVYQSTTIHRFSTAE